MPRSPIVSVIIPSLQEEKLLDRILSQFTADIKEKFSLEVIVSDGGSTDGTLAIARTYADEVVEANPQIKQNISVGRNAGARVARGKIFVFLNADTIVEDLLRFLEEMTSAVERPGIAGATCSVGVYKEEEGLWDKLFHCFCNRYFHLLNEIGLGMGRGECHVVSRRLFEHVGGYNEAIAAGEDFDLFRRLRRHGRIAFLRHLRVRESPRRYRKYGYFLITLMWLANAVAVLLFGRSFHRHWTPIR